ncbi:MAG: hypothetical protein IJT47_06175 [Selenomonadaceae bacterium]|nr:hypothetical protein [Selenomonadaceae bacterium]MBQ4403562.1 hypothetical protein [Selenomonadaceae bacterium]MBQ7493994.1 hypothetical protein [Selenomonadaceae bacterium]
MTEQERINAEVQTKLALQDAKFNMFMQEMRDRDNQRAEDIREIRTSISNIQNRIDDMGKHVRNLSLTAMGAIGAMVVTVIISLIKS